MNSTHIYTSYASLLRGSLFAATLLFAYPVCAQDEALPAELPSETSNSIDFLEGAGEAEDTISPAAQTDDVVAGPPTPAPAESQGDIFADSLPDAGLDQDFDFSLDEGAQVEIKPEKTEAELKEEARKKAYNAALEGLLPLRPEEIRTLLERFDRTQESVETPIYPNPKPEVVVENISLDPGAKPAVIKMAYGHVTTVTFLDSSGAPWPVQDISWAGNFEIINSSSESENEEESFTHMFRISPQSEFAYGNMSVTLTALRTPVIITLETNRDLVHYRFDAVLPDYGPLAEAPIIQTGVTAEAGGAHLSSLLEGVMPTDAERLNVAGVDGRTSAYRYNGNVYVRTPLTLLSPGWTGSASSSDGTRVYEVQDTPVLLLSDKGRMTRAKLSNRVDILESVFDE